MGVSQKTNYRKQLEADLAVFLSEGKSITKLPMYGKKRKPKQVEEETVEIEVEHLPEALRKKHFGDE